MAPWNGPKETLSKINKSRPLLLPQRECMSYIIVLTSKPGNFPSSEMRPEFAIMIELQ